MKSHERVMRKLRWLKIATRVWMASMVLLALGLVVWYAVHPVPPA
jgi:hypothetical protein